MESITLLCEESSHIFQQMKMESKIKKLKINITLIYENDNNYQQKIFYPN